MPIHGGLNYHNQASWRLTSPLVLDSLPRALTLPWGMRMRPSELPPRGPGRMRGVFLRPGPLPGFSQSLFVGGFKDPWTSILGLGCEVMLLPGHRQPSLLSDLAMEAGHRGMEDM